MKKNVSKKSVNELSNLVAKLSNLSKEEIQSKSFKQLIADYDYRFHTLNICLDFVQYSENKNWYKDETITSNEWGSKALLLKNTLEKVFTKKEIKTITVKDIVKPKFYFLHSASLETMDKGSLIEGEQILGNTNNVVILKIQDPQLIEELKRKFNNQ